MMERLTFEGNFCDIAVCMEPSCKYPETGCTQRQVWERLKMYEDMAENTSKHIPYTERRQVYSNALAKWGDRAQMIVAIEELSECQKEICKILRGGENFPHLAEEIADATIMLEQLRLMFNINEQVLDCMDAKVRRLDDRLGGDCDGKA